MNQRDNPTAEPSGDRLAALQARVEQLEKELAANLSAQQELREAGDLLSRHLDNMPLGVLEWDSEFRLVRWSGTAEQIFGWKAEEVCGKKYGEWRFVHDDDLDDVNEIARRLLTGVEQSNISNNRNYRRDNSVVFCQWCNSVLLDEEGRLVSILSHVQDMSRLRHVQNSLHELNRALQREAAERRRAEAALASANERMHFLLAATPVVIYSCSVEGERNATFVSNNIEQVFGYRAEQVISTPGFWMQHIHPEDRQRAADSIPPEAGDEPRVNEYRFRCHSDEYRWVRDVVRRVHASEDGADELVGYCLDIQEQKQVEQQLRLVQSAIDQVDESVVITDAVVDRPGPHIIYANPAFYRVTGYTPQEVIGRSPRILQGPATSRAILRRVRASLMAGHSLREEAINYRKDGSIYHVEWQIAPVRNEAGEIVNWVSIQRDITHAKRQEEEANRRDAEMAHAARLSTMGEMASGIAHELNQPLAAIANYVHGCQQRLRSGRISPEELSTVLERVVGQAERSGEIIRRMRNFVRKREPQREAADVNDLVHNVVGLLQPEARRRGVQIDLELTDDPAVLRLDTIQIEQVIVNLLQNSFDAIASNEPGDRRVRIRTVTEPDAVRIEVSDNGPGLKPQELDRIFDPFYTTKSEGMGVGLNISESIIHSHNGKLHATNNPDRGTTFVAILFRQMASNPV